MPGSKPAIPAEQLAPSKDAQVTEVGEPYLTLEVADGVRVRVLKSQVSQVVPKGTMKAA